MLVFRLFLSAILFFVLFMGVALFPQPSYLWVDTRYIVALSVIWSVILSLYQRPLRSSISLLVPLALSALVAPILLSIVTHNGVIANIYWREQAFFLYFYLVTVLFQTILLYFNFLKSSVWLATISRFCISLYPVILLAYYVKFSNVIDESSLIAIYQTNSREAWEFVSSFFAPLAMLGVVAIVVILLWAHYFLSNSMNLNCDKLASIKGGSIIGGHSKKIAFQLLVCLLITIVFGHYVKPSYIQVIKGNTEGYFSAAQEHREYRRTHSPVAHTALQGDNTFIVVVGESSNRKHMGAYGYNRPTTPWLSEMRGNKNFVFMENAYTSHVTTVYAVTAALSERNQFNNKKISTSYSLLDIAAVANFKTVWISNQPRYGEGNNPISLMADGTEQQFWANENLLFTSAFDERVLPYLDKIPRKALNLVVIHLMGSHHVYKERYPQEFDHFKSTEDIVGTAKSLAEVNYYDNSILYTDFVLSKIYEFALRNNVAGMVYFSDHAEDVHGGSMHMPAAFNMEMARIPMFIYLSDTYQKNNAGVFSALTNNRQKYFTNDLVYDTLVSILRIDTPHTDRKYSIASDDYAVQKADLRILDRKYAITE